MFLTGNYPVATWFAYVCVGLVVGRLDLSSRRVALRLVAAGTAVAAAAWGASWLLLHPLGGLSRLLALPLGTEDPVSELLSVGREGSFPPTAGGGWPCSARTPVPPRRSCSRPGSPSPSSVCCASRRGCRAGPGTWWRW
nr:hypothetical protein [Pseudonocardia sp. AL041005-10]